MSFDEKLIEEIKKYELLYNVKHLNFRNVDLKQVLWIKIAEKLNASDEKCRKRWKGLRDTYKHLKKYKQSGRPPKSRKMEWKYFKQLKFLDNFDSGKDFRVPHQHLDYYDSPSQEQLDTAAIELFSTPDGPHASTSYDPQASTSANLQASTSANPQASTSVGLQASTSIDPLASISVDPLASTSVGPLASTSDISSTRMDVVSTSSQPPDHRRIKAETDDPRAQFEEMLNFARNNSISVANKSSTEQLFEVLARKITEADLSEYDLLNLEFNVIQMVFDVIKNKA